MFDLGNEKVNLKEIPIIHESHQQIKWTLLFLDLMYVGVIYNVDYILVYCGSENNPLVFFVAFCYFAVMFNTRYSMDFYSSSFISLLQPNDSFPLLQNDVFHRAIFVIYGLGIYLSTINISEDVEADATSGDFGNCNFNSQYTNGFTIGFIISRMTILFWNAVIVFYSPLPAFRTIYFYSFCSRAAIAFLSVLVMLANFRDPDNIVYCLPIVVALDIFADPIRAGVGYLVTYYTKDPCTEIEIHEEHHAKKDSIYCNAEVILERMGLIFMLVLGEAIVGFTFSTYTSENDGTWRSQIFAYLLLVSIGMLFYETVDRVNFENHALVKSLAYRTAFYLLHIMSSIFLLGGIAGVIELYADSGNILPAGFTNNDDDHVTDDHSGTAHDDHSGTAHDDHTAHVIDVQYYSWLVSIGLTGMETCLELMRFLHEPVLFKHFRFNDYTVWIKLMFRLSMMLHLAIYFIADATNTSSDMIIVAHAIVVLATNLLHVATTTYGRPNIGSEYTGKDVEVGSNASVGGGFGGLGYIRGFYHGGSQGSRNTLMNKHNNSTDGGGVGRLTGFSYYGGATSSLHQRMTNNSTDLRTNSRTSSAVRPRSADDQGNSAISAISGISATSSSSSNILHQSSITTINNQIPSNVGLPTILEEETTGNSFSIESSPYDSKTRYKLMED
jgi:hypothetical protein